jgi:putative NIF3 family GTP cyclohydrolase 1 type 2
VDDTSGLTDDPVLAAKQSYLDAHGLVVWRFHDHWHRRRPDGIAEGVVRALGWTPYKRPGDPPCFDLPETTVGELAADMAAKLGSHAPRIVGEPGMRIARVGIAPGAAPSRWHFEMLQRDDVDVLVAGEAREWEAVEYVRDAVAAGRTKALVLLGHAASEEAGMQFCAEWLRGFVTEVPVQFVPAGDPFAVRASAD